MTDSEQEALKQFENAKRLKKQLQQEIEQGRKTKAEQLQTLDHLWRHVKDFTPKHWSKED